MRSVRHRPQTHATRRTATRLATFAALAAGAAGAAGATLTTAGLASAPAPAPTAMAGGRRDTDFHIKFSEDRAHGGQVRVQCVQNKGQTTHALAITGPGLSKATSRNIQPGQSTRLTVTFKKGAYDVFCPVPGHKALGMNMNISVGGATTTSKSSSSTAGGGGAAF